MRKLVLNTEKIQSELDRLGKGKKWLANKMGNTQAMVTYVFKKKPISFAVKFGKIFDLDPKDLIK